MEKTNAVMVITTNMISMGVMIINNMLDRIDQAKLNVLVKDIVARHRERTINAHYDVLAEKFHNVLAAGPDEFIRAAQTELDRVDNINSFIDLRNKCPLITYVLTGSIKVLGKFNLSCQPTSGKVYAAYVTAVQALDDVI